MSIYRVLIVDDQRDIRNILRVGLETLDPQIKVIDVPSGEEAILVTTRQPIDLLVTDVRLAGISGLELLERARIRNPDLKVILITGMTDPKVQRQVAASGAYAFFYKPIELSDFLATVRNCLGLKEKAAPKPIPPEEPGPQSLPECLEGLHREMQAFSVVLLDDHGQVVAQDGDLPAEIDVFVLSPALMTAYNASAKLSRLLGVDYPRDAVYVAGKEYDFFLVHVGQALGLWVIVPGVGWDEIQMLKHLRTLDLAVKNLVRILTNMGVSLEVKAEISPEQSEELLQAVPEMVEEPVVDLEAIFKQVPPDKPLTAEAEAFWDSAVHDAADSVVSPDAISYEQARALGLAPEE
ncbi:MAG: response regulator [Anaerolineales bacterium]|nr:response regulator [Anaerolineales bacterium]